MWTSQSGAQQLYIRPLEVVPTEVQLVDDGGITAESRANVVTAFLREATPAEPEWRGEIGKSCYRVLHLLLPGR